MTASAGAAPSGPPTSPYPDDPARSHPRCGRHDRPAHWIAADGGLWCERGKHWVRGTDLDWGRPPAAQGRRRAGGVGQTRTPVSLPVTDTQRALVTSLSDTEVPLVWGWRALLDEGMAAVARTARHRGIEPAAVLYELARDTRSRDT